MMLPHPLHTIRLRGPWDYSLLPAGDSAALAATGKTELPCDGSFLAEPFRGTSFRGTLRLVRRFGRPTGLEPTERVRLVMDCTGELRAATLNGAPLCDSAAVPEAVDITAQLLPRNELVFEVALPSDFLLTDVRLEMHHLPPA